MICPRWVETKAQPIAIEDLVAYLLGALDLDPGEGLTVEIGGADQVTYGDLMREYAAQRGLRRWFIPVPFLTPRLSSLWLGLTTPVYARVGRKLIEGVSNPTVVRDDAARRLFPAIVPMGLRRSIERALANEDEEFAATRWSDALSSGGTAPGGYGGLRVGARLVDSRVARVPTTAAQGVRADPADRRRARLVLRRLPLAPPRLSRPPRRRSRSPPGPAPPGGSWPWGTRSTSGASRPSSPTGGCASPQR